MKLILNKKNKLVINKIESNWSKFGNDSFFLFKGYFFYNKEFYFKENLPKFILDKEISLNELNGCYALIIYKENKLKIILDRLGSIPLFYQKKEDVIIIYDRLYSEDIPNFHIDEISKAEFLAADYVSGENTLFKEIKEFDTATSNTIYFLKNNLVFNINKYWNFKRNQKYFGNTKKLEKEYLNILDEVFKDYVSAIKKINKPPCLFLSAGLDSRLIAFGLKKHELYNLKTLTRSSPDRKGDKLGSEIAKLLNLENIKFNVPTPEDLEKSIFEISNRLKADQILYDYLLYVSCFRSVPIFHILSRFYTYLNRPFLFKKGVYMEGHAGGDFLAGARMLRFDCLLKTNFKNIDKVLYSTFYSKHKVSKEIEDGIKKRIKKQINISSKKSKIFLSSIIEKWLLENIQRKSLISSMRFFEWIGSDWILPLCDYRLFNFYEKIPYLGLLRKKFYINALRKYFNKDILSIPREDGSEIKNKIFILDFIENIIKKAYQKCSRGKKDIINDNFLGRGIINLIYEKEN